MNALRALLIALTLSACATTPPIADAPPFVSERICSRPKGYVGVSYMPCAWFNVPERT